MHKVAATLSTLVLVCAGAMAQGGPSIPENIKAPSDQRLVLRAHATGAQIYTCQPSASGSSQLAWTFTAPEAVLTDESGKEVLKHFAGPTWQSPDGSLVKGKVLSQVAPNPDSIPWLLLTATDHSGSGSMRDVRSIQRVNTKGGKAPTEGCDAQHKGETTHVAYSADYYFYSQAK